MSLNQRVYEASVCKCGKPIFSGAYFDAGKAHNAIARSMRARLRNGSIAKTDVVTVCVQDMSGYFPSCREIFEGYYKKSISVSEYLRLDTE